MKLGLGRRASLLGKWLNDGVRNAALLSGRTRNNV